MNATQLRCLSVLIVFAIIGFGPISLTALTGIYVVLFRPAWFWQVTAALYRDKVPGTVVSGTSRGARLKALWALLLFLLLDVAPVPVTGTIGLAIVLVRPLWFYHLIERIYGGTTRITKPPPQM